MTVLLEGPRSALPPTKEAMDEFVAYVGEKVKKPNNGIDYEGAYEQEECHQAD
jgi:hypothetical protein